MLRLYHIIPDKSKSIFQKDIKMTDVLDLPTSCQSIGYLLITSQKQVPHCSETLGAQEAILYRAMFCGYY